MDSALRGFRIRAEGTLPFWNYGHSASGYAYFKMRGPPLVIKSKNELEFQVCEDGLGRGSITIRPISSGSIETVEYEILDKEVRILGVRSLRNVKFDHRPESESPFMSAEF